MHFNREDLLTVDDHVFMEHDFEDAEGVDTADTTAVLSPTAVVRNSSITKQLVEQKITTGYNSPFVPFHLSLAKLSGGSSTTKRPKSIRRTSRCESDDYRTRGSNDGRPADSVKSQDSGFSDSAESGGVGGVQQTRHKTQSANNETPSSPIALLGRDGDSSFTPKSGPSCGRRCPPLVTVSPVTPSPNTSSGI